MANMVNNAHMVYNTLSDLGVPFTFVDLRKELKVVNIRELSRMVDARIARTADGCLEYLLDKLVELRYLNKIGDGVYEDAYVEDEETEMEQGMSLLQSRLQANMDVMREMEQNISKMKQGMSLLQSQVQAALAANTQLQNQFAEMTRAIADPNVDINDVFRNLGI